MPLLERINVKKSWPFVEPVSGFLGGSEQDLTAKVFSSNNEAWISNGPSLCVVQIPSGHPRPIWEFGTALKDTMDVTCVEELSLDHNGRSSVLLVGTSSERRSQLCFLNLNTNLLFRAVNLPFQVRCISVIDDGLGSVNPLPDILSKMHGIVALGGADGSVILVDLNRSHVVHGAKWGAPASYKSEESKPRRSKVISPPCDDLDGYFNELKEFQENGDSLAISLLVGHGNDGVTCLQYSKLTSSLYVGYSSGTWQIWNISTFELLYENGDIDLPVFSFCEMEPCDDPDATIYVWVSYQSASNPYHCMVFHSTVYNSKYYVQDYGVYYKDFLNCAQNFTINMESEINNCVGSKLISCETFAKSIPRNQLFNIGLPSAEDGQGRLFVAAFNAYGGSKSSSTWLCVFDLEQWYREQLPKDIRHDNYFLEWIEIYPEELLVVKIVPDTIRLPSFEEPQEIHLIPEALNFDIVAMNREGIISIEKVGRQTRWLRNVSSLGARCLLHPDKLYQSCVAAGFTPQYVANAEHFGTSEEQKRKYLLSVCLEHGLKSIILDAAEIWSDGHYTVKNCTLRFLLEWLWSTLQSCFKLFNSQCEILFSAPGFEIDDRMKRSLHRTEVTLCLIESLYIEIVKKHGLKIWADCPEKRLSAMSLIRLVVGQITWFLGCGLLPEANSDGLPSSSPVYNYEAISRFSKNRREHLRSLQAKKRLLGDGPVVPPPCGLYLADSLLSVNQNSVYSQWEIEGGLACYPPPSLQSLLRMCTIVDVPENDKKAMVYYAVLDYVNNLDENKFSSLIKKIFSFEYMPGITTRKAKVVKGLWLIDHSEYQEGVKLLLEKSVLSSDLTDDQHRAVVRVLLLEDEAKLALHYLKVRGPQTYQLDDLKHELSLLLTNKHLVHHAFQFIRQHSQFKQQLLVQFFAGCIETKEINQVFNFHFNSSEMEVFEKFLSSKKGQLYEDLHVLLLLTHSKYTDAIALHEKYSQNGHPKDPLKFDTRDTIIKGISSSLCDVTRREARIANNPNLMNLPETKGLKVNKPLSVYLKCTRENGLANFRYDADQVMAVFLASSKLLNHEPETEPPGKKPTTVEMPHTGSLLEATYDSRRKRMGPVADPRPNKRARLEQSSSVARINERATASQMNGEANHISNDVVPDDITAILDMPLIRRRSKETHSTPRRNEGPPSSILKSGKTPQTPAHGVVAQAVENDTPRKTLRWNIPTDSSRETLIDSVKKVIVPDIEKPIVDESKPSDDEDGSPPLSPDSIRDGLRPRKCKESPLQERKVIPEDDWKAMEEDTIEKPLFAVTLPTKKKIMPVAAEPNEPNFIERLKKLTETTQKVEFIEEMDVDDEEKGIPAASDLSITIDGGEMSIFGKNIYGKTPDTTVLGDTVHMKLFERDDEDKKGESSEVTKELVLEKSVEETEQVNEIEEEEQAQEEIYAPEVVHAPQEMSGLEMEYTSQEVPEAEQESGEVEQEPKESSIAVVEVGVENKTLKTDRKKSRGSSVDQIQIRHAVSLSQVQHVEEDDDEESEDPEEAEIPPIIEFFPPEEGLVVNPKYHENVDDDVEVEQQEDEQQEEEQEEEDYGGEVEYEAQQAVVETEQEESNDEADSDGSSVIICLSDSDKSDKEENEDSENVDEEEDISPEYDSNSSSVDLGRGNRSFFHDKFIARAESEDEPDEHLELKVDDHDDEEEEEKDEGGREGRLEAIEEESEEEVDYEDQVGEPVLEEPEVLGEEPEVLGEKTELEAISEEEDDEVHRATAALEAYAEEEEEEEIGEVEVSDPTPEAEPEQTQTPDQFESETKAVAVDKPETLDLINLNKGQMFFGSPDNLKSTTNSDLATFQIAPGSNLPPPSPEPSKEEQAVSWEESVEPIEVQDTLTHDETPASPDPINVGFVAVEMTATPKVTMSTPLRKSLRLLQRQTPGRQIVPDDEVVESPQYLDVAVLGSESDNQSDASSLRMVDKSVLTVKRFLDKSLGEPTVDKQSGRKKGSTPRRQSSEPPELLTDRTREPRRQRRASSVDLQDKYQRAHSPPESAERKRRSRRSSSKEPVEMKKEKRTRKTSESDDSVGSRKTQSSSAEPDKQKKQDSRNSSKKSEERSTSRSQRTVDDTDTKDSSSEGKAFQKKKLRHPITEPLDMRKQKYEDETTRDVNPSTSRGSSSRRKRAMSVNDYPVSSNRARKPLALECIQELPEESMNPPVPKRRATRSVADGEVGRRRSRAPCLPPSALDINKWLQFQKTQEPRRSKRLTSESSTASQQASPRRSSRRLSSHNVQLNHLYNQLTEQDEDNEEFAHSPAKSSVTSIASSRISARRRPSSRNSLQAEEAASPILTPTIAMTQEQKEQVFEEHSQQRIMTRKQTTFLQRCLGMETPSTPSNAAASSSSSRRAKEDEETPKTSRKKPH